MRIGGFLKQSLIDWEGRIVAVVFTKGCNFRCGYCHNPSLVVPELLDRTPDVPQERVLDYLASRRQWLEGVVVSGGEPTLQPDLAGFLTHVREMGFPVKLDTNGTHPEILSELFCKKIVNFVALDVKHLVTQQDYAAVTPTVKRSETEAVVRTVGLLRKHPEVERLFRTTLIPNVHTPEVVRRLSEWLAPDTICFQKFRPGELVGNYL